MPYYLLEKYDYAIFRDRWHGKPRWQAHWLWDGEPMPVSPPVMGGRGDADFDAVADWQTRRSNAIAQGRLWPDREARIDPIERRHDWSAMRRWL